MQSPFLFKPGTIFEEPAEKVIQMSDMNQLVKNRALDEIDIRILLKIHENVFLTAGLIGKLFERELYYTNNFSKNRMRKFIRYGLVRRFYITFDGKEAIHNRTVNFYSLTDASMKYLKKYFGVKSYQLGLGDMAKLGDVLSILSMNQAIINYSKMTSSFDRVSYDRFKNPREMIIHMYDKVFKIVCIRRDRVSQTHSKKSGDVYHQQLFLIEDELFAIDLIKNLKGELKGSLLFITDLMMVSEDMRDSYLVIRNESSIIEYKLEGLVTS